MAKVVKGSELDIDILLEVQCGSEKRQVNNIITKARTILVVNAFDCVRAFMNY